MVGLPYWTAKEAAHGFDKEDDFICSWCLSYGGFCATRFPTRVANQCPTKPPYIRASNEGDVPRPPISNEWVVIESHLNR